MKYTVLYERLMAYKKKAGYKTKQQKEFQKKYQSLLLFKVYPMASKIVRARGTKIGGVLRKMDRLHQNRRGFSGTVTRKAYAIAKREGL